VGFVAGSLLYSYVLFSLASPGLSETLRIVLSSGPSGLPTDWRQNAIVAIALVEFAVAEEFIFRLGLQNWFAKVLRLPARGYWVAVALSSAVWALAHANTLDPEWVKIAQVFPMGIALGFLFRKFGVECCIFAHAAFNLAMACLGPGLVRF
jgi:membrane protease YdiL (CAAX protease family)